MEIEVVTVQFGTGYDKKANVKKALAYLDEIAERGWKPNLICMPELFTLRRPERVGDKVSEYAEPVPGPLCDALAYRAKRLGAWMVGGSFLEAGTDGRYYNTSPVFNPKGDLVAAYRKIHLFDAPGGHQESAVITAGNSTVTVKTEFGTIGVLICYDLRFPELARTLALAGADILCVPNSWPTDGLLMAGEQLRILLQATALQNLANVVHANQFGEIDGELHLCGRSCVVDPWGQIIAQAPNREGLLRCVLDTQHATQVRKTRPIFSHRRPDLYTV